MASYGQALINSTALRNPDLIALQLTAKSAKLGTDYNVAIKPQEAKAKSDFTQPLRDVSGDTIGQISLSFKTTGMKKDDLEVRAKKIAADLARRISNVENLMQPDPYDPKAPSGTMAQSVVDETLLRHPEILILVAHVTPPGSKANIIAGSNIGRIGKLADEDDMRVITTEKTNLEVNDKGNRFEVELVLHDRAGNNIGALGVVFAYKPGDDRDAFAKAATIIRDEMAAKTPSLVSLFQKAPLTFAGRTDLVGYSGDFDHFAVDGAGNRLFLAAEDHGTLEVFNLKSGAHKKTVKGVEVPHSILFLADVNRLIVTDSAKSMTKTFDATTYKPTGTIPLVPGADSFGYDPSRGRLYVVTGGKDANMAETYLQQIDARTGALINQVKFDVNKVEAMAIEKQGKRLFINVTGKTTISVFDKETLAQIFEWPFTEAQMNAPMAMDEVNHRLFIVSRKPGMLVVKNAETGASIASFSAPERCDEVVFDEPNHRIYVLGGEGRIGVFHQIDADHYEEMPSVSSEAGAKTGILISDQHRLYLAVSPGDGKLGAGVIWYDVGKAQ
jgi:sugar lactone lactonase YvrE